MKVLIVDDNANDRALLRYVVERNGHEVLEAENGRQGLEAASAGRPDLILSDALMPVMDGFQFLQHLKADETLGSLPFIFYSAAYRGEKDIEFARDLGAAGYIIKPREPAALWQDVLDLLKTRESKPQQPSVQLKEDEDYRKRYSDIVATKLEEKVYELEAANAQVEAKKAEWEATFDAIGDAISVHDRDFNVVMANKACADVLGLARETITTKKCYEMFHGKTEPIDGCPMVTAMESGKRSETELFEPHLKRWLNVSCFPLVGKDGRTRGVIHYAKDITQKKTSEELMKHILDTVDEGFIIIDREFRILSANRAYADKLKMPVEDILGKHCYEVSHHFSKPCYESEGHPCKIKNVFETGESGTAMHTHYDKEGTPVYCEIRAYPLSKDENGKVSTAIETVIDITEKKNLENQLRQAQKMEAVGQLAGGVAHDFNNILTSIIGYSSMLLDKLKGDDPNRHMVQMVLESGERAAHLTQSLLAFSRKQALLPKVVDINKVIRNVERLLQRIIGEDIEFSANLSEAELAVMADEMQFEQVLMNLATNARDAMPEGGALTIGTEPVELDRRFIDAHGYGKPGWYALITVTDTGMGMNEETRRKIFEPFFTTKELGKGTGLGLSIVYGIVKQHDGYINVYSEPGKGTTFRIYLPLTKERAAEEKIAERAVETGGSETILVAEDDGSVRTFTKTVLEGSGYRVIEAVDGEDAVSKFRAHQEEIDLLLFDVIMPKMDGKTAYERIREVRPGVKALFTSGYTQDFISKKLALEEGMGFIYKPVSPTALLKKVREALGK